MRKTAIIMLALFVATFIMGCSSSGGTDKPTETAPSASTAPQESSSPEKAEKGTRKSPIPIGETATVKMGGATLEVTIQEVLRGDDVWTVAKQVDANDTPTDGCEFIVMKVKAKVIEGADDEPFNLGIVDFDVFSSDGAGLGGIYAYIPEEKTLTGEVFTGAEKEGYGTRQVKTGDPAPLARYGDVWFALT